ncbi:MAG: hypothetical protein ACTSRG_18210 [Candidatus Helarchaeota archaeon]
MEQKGESRTSSIFQTIGAVLLMIAIFLVFAGLGMIPGFPPDQDFLNYGMFLVVPAFFILLLSVFSGLNKDANNMEVFTTLQCKESSCKQIIIRDFKINDYVFKEVDEICPKCKSKMFISDISSIATKKIKERPEKSFKSKKPKIDKKEKNLKTITTLKCKNSGCDFLKTREFLINDYIFKTFNDQKCPKCGSSLYISEISHKNTEKNS